MTAYYATTATPIGPFTTVIDGDGAVIASGWTADPEGLCTLVHPSLRPTALARRTDLGAITRAVADYHGGDLICINTIAVTQHSGEFRSTAWSVLREVPPGEPITYTEFAALAGRPTAVRGAASACARNAAALFVPCHRVVRVGGALGGFRWGQPAKRWLLAHEDQYDSVPSLHGRNET